MTNEVVIKSFAAPVGAEIKYVDEGQGVPFLFIYGMGSSVTSQDLFIKFMREHCRMIVFDQRGYGFTKAQGEIGIHQSARDAKALMEYLGIDKYILMGYSMGAAVVFSYVQQFGTGNLIKVLTGDMSPKLINEGDWKLGLYQGHYTREMYEEDLNIIKNDYERYALYLTEQLLYKHNPEDPREPYNSKEEIKARIESGEHNPLIRDALYNGMVYISDEQIGCMTDYWITMASADFREVLKKIDVPTAIIYANPGSGYQPATAEFMASQIPDAILCPADGCTHMLAAEKNDLYKKYITDFCGF